MSDIMLLGALRMPLPDDPAEVDSWVWHQLKDRIQEAADRIERDAVRITGLEADLREEQDRRQAMRTEWAAEAAALTAQARHAEDCLDAARERIAALEESERLSAIARVNMEKAVGLLLDCIDELQADPMPRLDHNWRTGQPAASQAEIDAWSARQAERRKLDWSDSTKGERRD